MFNIRTLTGEICKASRLTQPPGKTFTEKQCSEATEVKPHSMTVGEIWWEGGNILSLDWKRWILGDCYR